MADSSSKLESWSVLICSLQIMCLIIASGAEANAATPAAVQHSNVDDVATVHVPAFAMPFSPLVSVEAKHAFLDRIEHPLPWDSDDIPKTRLAIQEQFYKPLLRRLHELFKVNISPQTFDDVPTDVITPQDGIPEKNVARVLINLHGGNFMVGAGAGGQVESIPIAALGRIKVISVNYREAPEYKFPTASEDVAKVYKHLLTSYSPRNIGIYGCSSGGVLATESLAWFQSHQLPVPGAVGIFGAGAMAQSIGDSRFTGSLLTGGQAPELVPQTPPKTDYFAQADLRDPLVSPVYNTAVLSRFPPSLVLTSTRDTELSDAVYTHTQLVKAGVESDLHVWEGMRHCFFYWPDPPESRDAWNVVVRFFDGHLGEQVAVAPGRKLEK